MLMPWRRCGQTGLYLSALALNLGAREGSGLAFMTTRALVHQALEWNINLIDLVSCNGMLACAAESGLGRLLESELRAHRNELIVTTSAGDRSWPGPYGIGGSRKHVLGRLDQTLRRLRLDYVDILCVGPFDRDTPLEETMAALHKAVRQGKVRYAGVSAFSSSETLNARLVLDQLGTPLAIHHSATPMVGRGADEALIRVLEREGVGAIRHCSRPPAAEPHQHRDAVFDDLARKRGQTPAQLAIAWALLDPGVSSVSLPAAGTEDLNEFAAALENLSFTAEERNVLSRWVNPRVQSGGEEPS
jgi:L-glyceraldehyde 3-phosphate reductase